MRKQFLILAIALAAIAGVFFNESRAGLGSHPNGPVAYYPFDDGTADDAAHTNDGTLVGNASFSTDVPPTAGNVKSLSLDGTGDYVDAGSDSSLDITGSITLAAWIKPAALGTFQEFINKGDYDGGTGSFTYFFLIMTPSDKIRAGIDLGAAGDFLDSSSTVTAGTWYHVVSTFNPTTNDVKIYIDGSLDSSGTITNDPPSRPSDPLYIGALKNGAGVLNEFNGLIDEPQIYNRVLTQAEIDLLAGVTDPLFVDDDGQIGFGSLDCDGVGVGAYSTIQDAVDAASPGDTITVCPGTYDEQVAITTDNLTIDGAGAGLTIVQPTSVVANTTSLTSGSSYAVIILVDGATGVTVQDLTVDGSAAAFNSCSPGYMGVFFRNASGELDASEVTNIFHPAAVGCQGVLGVFVQSGGAGSSTVAVTDSDVDNYGKNGITCNGAGTTCTITGNTVTGRGPVPAGDAAQNGVQVGWLATGTISGNTVSDHSYLPANWAATNVLVVDADVDIIGNTLNEGYLSIYFIDGSGDISNNNISNTTAGVGFSTFWGIAVADPPSVPPSPFYEAPLMVASISGDTHLALGPASHSATMVVNISGNTIDGDDGADSIGIEVDAGFGVADLDVDITQNTITDFDYGVVFFEGTAYGGGTFTDAHVNFNNITSNVTSGIENLADVSPPPLSPLDAECNWYGNASGPSGAGPGTGDAVSTEVDFNPWLDGPFQSASDCGDADLKVTAVAIECDDPVDVNTPLNCDVDVSVHNNGPLDPANAKVTVGINVPADCQDPADYIENLSLAVSVTQTVSKTFTTQCSVRSNHTFTGTGVIEEGVSAEDPDLNNNSGSAQDTNAVFDLADAKVPGLTIDCPAVATHDVPFTCTVEITVHNNGPTTPVDVGGATNVGVPNDCTVTNYQLFGQGFGLLQLDVSVSQTVSEDFEITCANTGINTIVGCGIVQVNQLHVRDQIPVANNYGVAFTTTDVQSIPNPIVLDPGRCTTVDPPEICGNGIDDDGDGLTDEEPDTDGDGVNNCDDLDDDGDGFSDVVEEYVGTAPLADCPWVAGVHPAWPPDFDDSQDVNIIDVLAVKPAFGSAAGDAGYVARIDLNADGSINIVDVLSLKPVFGTSCN